jgi:hypothetical protein
LTNNWIKQFYHLGFIIAATTHCFCKGFEMTNLNGLSLIYFPQFLYCETMTKTSEKGQTYALKKEERLKRGLVRNDEVCRVKKKEGEGD